MLKSLKRIAKIIIGLAILGYIVFCLTVYFFPQLFFYDPLKKPSRIEFARLNGYPAQKVTYQAQDGTPLYAWYTAPQNNKPIIVFMHGNSYNIEKFYHKLVPLIEAGYGSLLPEYRGFGDVKGQITEANLEQDAQAAIKYLYSLGVKNSSIYVYGMSLGSYTATHVAYALGKTNPFAGLILEVPFDSMYNDVKDIVKFPLPVKLIMRDKYENQAKIKSLQIPLLIMGGSEDTLVPVKRAEALYEIANEPKKIIVYQGASHADLYNYRNYKDILKWLTDNEKIR